MPLSDDIDASIPADNVQVNKADLRANTAATKAAIANVERNTSFAWRMATGAIPITE